MIIQIIIIIIIVLVIPTEILRYVQAPKSRLWVPSPADSWYVYRYVCMYIYIYKYVYIVDR